jgi:hypothetical protein
MTPLDLFLNIVAGIGGLGIGIAIIFASVASFPKISELIDALCDWAIDRINGG